MKHQVSRRRFLADLSCWSGGLALAGGLPLSGAGCASAPQPQSTLPTGDATTAYIYDPRCLEYPHPDEAPERASSIHQRLSDAGLAQHLLAVEALAAPDPFIQMVHTDDHISSIKAIDRGGPAAQLAVAGVLGAARAVCEGRAKNAFCTVRPPGHHAQNTGHSEGFCYYGNIAVAAQYAQRTFGIKKILIIDWDYHHGNGTELAFYDDPSVLFFSTHDRDAYPNTGLEERTGSGAGEGFNVNVHMPTGSADDAFVRVFEERLLPAADAFKPELVLVSAGFDSKQNDALGRHDVTPCGFSRLTLAAMHIAEQHAKGRLVSALEGGYADYRLTSISVPTDGGYVDRTPPTFDGLAASAEAHVATLVSGDLQRCAS